MDHNNPLLKSVTNALASMSLDLDLPGGGAWAPSRSPKKDYSRWGVWEAWPFCRIGKLNECTVGPVPTGDWVAWNSQTGAQISCGGGPKAQWKAEMLAVSQNQGMPTRVVDLNGTATESRIKLRDCERLLAPAVKDYETAVEEAKEAAALASITQRLGV